MCRFYRRECGCVNFFEMVIYNYLKNLVIEILLLKEVGIV